MTPTEKKGNITIITISVVVGITGIFLMAAQGVLSDGFAGILFGLFYGGFPALPIFVLGVISVFKKIPTVTAALTVFEICVLIDLFYNVFFAPNRSAFGEFALIIIPAGLLLLNLLIAAIAGAVQRK